MDIDATGCNQQIAVAVAPAAVHPRDPSQSVVSRKGPDLVKSFDRCHGHTGVADVRHVGNASPPWLVRKSLPILYRLDIVRPPRAQSSPCPHDLVQRRERDHTGCRFSVALQPDRRAPERHAAHERLRAVHRVKVPAKARRAGLLAELFAQYGVVRKRFR